jgi:putative phosphoesterase
LNAINNQYEQKELIVRIGVISDTHGYLTSQAVKSLEGVDLIIHAGDLDTPDILKMLKKIAPVKIVRGNMDRGKWADELPQEEYIRIGQVVILALHDLYQIDLDPVAAGIHAVIYGHTHRPHKECKDGVVYINPGSASQPRHNFPPTVAIVTIRDRLLDIKFVEIAE